MNLNRRQLLAWSAAATAAATLPASVLAQGFPTKPVTLVVPFAPGGNTDLVARLLGVSLGKVLGQSVVIDNRAGGGGAIGAGLVARAPADGYTLLLCGAGVIVTLPEMIKVPYARAQFAPLGLVNKSSMVLLARAGDARFKNFAQLAAYAKSGAGKLAAAHSGPGTPNHLALLQLENALKTSFTVVSYKGSGPALVDLIGGQIDVHFDQVTSSLQHIRSGALVPLAVLGPTEDPALPGVPTIASLGLNHVDGTTYIGVLGPAGLPKDIQDRLAAAIQQAVKDPQMVQSARELGSVAYAGGPQEFAQVLDAEQTLAQRATKEGRLKAD